MAYKREEVEQHFTTALQKAGGDLTNVPALAQFVADELERLAKTNDPFASPRPTSGYLYDNGPFSLITDEIISEAVPGDSPISGWLPTSRYTNRFEHVAHLDWVNNGMDGSLPYSEWLRGQTIDDCGFGPQVGAWSGFEYKMDGGRFGFTTNQMKLYPDGGIKYHDKQPIYTLRGSNIGQPISDDREWAVARLLIVMAQHLDYVLKFGNRGNSDMEWDGISQILTPGYVAARVVGRGRPTWADPLIVNGASITTIGQLCQTLRVIARRLRRRVKDRNWNVAPGDQVVFMSQTMWDNMVEYIASGAFYKYSDSFGFDGQMSFRDYRQEIRDIKAGGVGYGVMDIDGFPLPVLTDSSLGVNCTIDPAGTPKSGITGDIYLLTKRVNGMVILEQQYLDYNKLEYPLSDPETTFTVQGGLVRAGWITKNNNCFHYYTEMSGRMVSYMQPLQAVIRNVTIETLDSNENESVNFTSPDWYAYNGQRGGVGNALVTGI
jgi:hypothetical protein